LAPTFKHGKDAVTTLTSATGGTINFSSGMDDSELARSVETAEVTTYSNDDKTYLPGLKDKTFSLSGHMSSTHAEKLDAMWGHSTGTTVNYSPMSTSTGNRLYTGKAIMTDYTIGSPVGDKVSVSLDFQGSGAWTSTKH
jgi:predicted secreted protein